MDGHGIQFAINKQVWTSLWSKMFVDSICFSWIIKDVHKHTLFMSWLYELAEVRMFE